MAVNDSTKGRLVTLRPGRYWKVNVQSGEQSSRNIDIVEPTNALLLEFQGKHNGSYVPRDNETCWHALVGGTVILVWESHFDSRNES